MYMYEVPKITIETCKKYYIFHDDYFSIEELDKMYYDIISERVGYYLKENLSTYDFVHSFTSVVLEMINKTVIDGFIDQGFTYSDKDDKSLTPSYSLHLDILVSSKLRNIDEIMSSGKVADFETKMKFTTSYHEVEFDLDVDY